MSPKGRNILFFVTCVLLVICFVYQCIEPVLDNSLCNDEAKHIVTGWWLAKHGEACLGIDNSPLTILFALPSLHTDLKLPPQIKMGSNAHLAGVTLIYRAENPEAILVRARAVMVVLGSITVILAALLSGRFFGWAGALLTLSMLTFDPNMIAHFTLASTDALLTCASVLFLLSLDWCLRKASLVRALCVGLCMGIAILSKYTALLLCPATLLITPLYYTYIKNKPFSFWCKSIGLYAASTILVIWAGYGFHTSSSLPFFTFPGFVQGLEQARSYATGGMVSFFCGQVGTSWPQYYVVAFLLKTPIPIVLFWIAAWIAAVCFVRTRAQLHLLSCLALALIFFAVCLTAKLNIGIRHMLPAYPLMAAFCGIIMHPNVIPASIGRTVKIIAAVMCFWLAAEAISIHPVHLSYFNQIAQGPKGGVQYLGDSNLDWGQDLKRLKQTMNRLNINEVILAYVGNTAPEYYGIQYQYLPVMFYGSTHNNYVVDSSQEILAISTNNLQGTLYRIPEPFAWLRKREPVARAGWSILLYDITGDAEAHAQLAKIYTAYGLQELAQKEQAKSLLRGLSRNS